MDLSGLISIAGMGGLHKVVAQTKSGLLVESLTDKKRIIAYAHYKVSALEEISIFSTGDDVPLKDIFQKMFDKHQGGPSIDHKASDEEVKKYFLEVFPEYDQERVYTSDIRKVINWYNALQKQDLLKAVPEEKKDEDAPKVAAVTEEKPKVKPKPVPASKDFAKVPKAPAGHKKTQGVRKTGVA